MLTPPSPPPPGSTVITIDKTELEVVDTFTSSTVLSSILLDAEISCRIVKAAAVTATLNKRVWGNDLLTEMTKNVRLLSLCPADSPLWQRVVDDLRQTKAATQRIPPPLPLAPAAHQVAGQSHPPGALVASLISPTMRPPLPYQCC